MQHSDSTHALMSEAPGAPTSDLVPLVVRWWRIVRYRKQVIISTLYCFALAGVIYYVLAPRYFKSNAQLLIVEQKPDQLTNVGETDATGNTMATHQKLVTSQVVINEAIARLAPEHRVDLVGVPPNEWTESISDLLGASTTRRTNIIDVSFRSRSPEAAAAVVRAVVESYLDFVKNTHQGAAGDNILVLTENHERVQQELNQTQSALQQFRQHVGHLAVSSEDSSAEPMIQRAVQLNEAVLEAQKKRVELQASLVAVQESVRNGEDISRQMMSFDPELRSRALISSMGISPEDLEMLGEQQKKLLEAQQMMQSLSADFGQNHPRMIALREQISSIEQFISGYHLDADARLDAIGQSVSGDAMVKLLEQSIRQAEQQEQQLITSYEEARSRAAHFSDALVQLAMLEREVERKEAHLDALAEKIRDFDISKGQGPIKATVVQEPLPSDVPATPQLRLVAALSLFGGLLVGGLLVYIQDTLDDRFSSPEELSAQVGVPVLAIVRQLESLPGEGLAAVQTFVQPNAVESESFRTLRTALSLGDGDCDRILVSSSEPGDGKTTVSVNLAVAFAQAGKRTLVIDADLRRPGMTALMNLKGRHGVADVLAAAEPAEMIAPQYLQGTELENLDVLPAGLRRPNPAELLSGKAFVELLAWADAFYDRVIVDCPPVLAVSDAQIVGHLVDGAVLVVRPEKNHRRSVIRAVESFQEASCRVLGVVANGVSQDADGYGYGYSYGYGDGYGSNYGHDEQEHEAETPEIHRFPQPKAPTGIRPRRAA